MYMGAIQTMRRRKIQCLKGWFTHFMVPTYFSSIRRPAVNNERSLLTILKLAWLSFEYMYLVQKIIIIMIIVIIMTMIMIIHPLYIVACCTSKHFKPL